MTISKKELSTFFNVDGGNTTSQSEADTIGEEKRKSWEQDWIKIREANLLEQGDSVTQPYSTAWVYRAVSVIAQNISQAPFIPLDSNKKPLPESSPVVKLFQNPNPTQSYFEWMESLISYLQLNGEAFVFMNPSIGQRIGTRNTPAELWSLNPNLVKHSFDGNNNLAGWVYGDMPIEVDEMIHLKLFNPIASSFRGFSPITALKFEMEADYSASKYNNVFFKNQANPAGVIEADKDAHIDIKELRKMKKLWYENHGGQQHAHRTAFLLNGLHYKQMGLTQKDMEFLEGRRFSRESIMAIFGVNSFVGGFYTESGITRATALASMSAFWDNTLHPMMQRIEQKFKSKFFMRFFGDGTHGKFDTSEIPVYKSIFTEDMQAAKDLFSIGYTRNEISNRLNLQLPDSDDDGNVRYLPMNLIAVGMEGDEDVDLDTEDVEQDTDKSFADLVANAEVVDLTGTDDDGNPLEKQKKNDAFFDKLQKNYLRVQGQMEKKFESKLRKYFLKLRRESLRALESATKALTPEERQKLIELLMGLFDDGEMKREVGPIYTEASQNAGEMALDNIGVTRPFIINDAILQSRMRYITEVNQTMFEEIRKIVDQSIVDGDTIPNLERTLKSKFNTWTNKKAKLVARTETASIMSAQTQFAYEQEGVKQKRWIATPDEKTRPSHKACERQGAIGINEKFSNGLLFPGDSANDATGGGEVISCRCSLAPEVV